MRARTLLLPVSAAMLAGCVAGGAAPVDFRGAGAPTPPSNAPVSGPAPIERRVPAASSPSQPPPERELGWEGQGAPLSTWALQPEVAQPYDPRNPDAAHVVAPGETLYTIAARRQTPLRALIDANGLTAPFRLEPGQVLVLPPPAAHVVTAGETLSSIARRYNVDLRSLALLNRMTPPYLVRPGDRIILPAGARAPAPPSPPPAPRPAGAAAPPGRLAWPLTGAVLTPFGADGGRAEAMEVAATPGAPVRAAADGRVLFAGDGPATLGGLVILDHGGGLVTTLGFLTGIQVREGTRVSLGETLALASRDRVLFQVREDGGPRDPQAFLSQP